MKTKTIRPFHHQPYGHHGPHARYFMITVLSAIIIDIILVIIFALLLRTVFS